MTNDDEKLRDDFARLRRVEARRTPSFEALRKPPVVRPLRPVVLAVVPLVAAAAALLFVCNGATQSEPSQTSSGSAVDLLPSAGGATLGEATDEPLPLDFLLQTHASYTNPPTARASAFDSDFLLRAPKNLRALTP